MNKLFSYTIALIFVITGCAGKHVKERMKIITLNARYDNPADSQNVWSARAGQIQSFFRDEKPDIIGLQELLWNQYRFLDSVLTDYSSVGSGREDGARKGELNPVFFRKDKYELVRSITFWLSKSPDVPGSKSWGSSLPRIVTWLELARKEDHSHFFLFNTHFAHDSDSARIKSSELLLNEVEKVTNGYPFIITGDFNMLPGSPGYEILTGPDQASSVINDSYVRSDRRPAGPSYTFNGFSDKAGNGRIDFIFVRNGIKVYEHRILVRKKGKVFISDHWPVVAVIGINKN